MLKRGDKTGESYKLIDYDNTLYGYRLVISITSEVIPVKKCIRLVVLLHSSDNSPLLFGPWVQVCWQKLHWQLSVDLLGKLFCMGRKHCDVITAAQGAWYNDTICPSRATVHVGRSNQYLSIYEATYLRVRTLPTLTWFWAADQLREFVILRHGRLWLCPWLGLDTCYWEKLDGKQIGYDCSEHYCSFHCSTVIRLISFGCVSIYASIRIWVK